MYKLLDSHHYSSLSPTSRLQELHLWLEDQLENHKSVLRISKDRSHSGVLKEALW